MADFHPRQQEDLSSVALAKEDSTPFLSVKHYLSEKLLQTRYQTFIAGMDWLLQSFPIRATSTFYFQKFSVDR